MRIQTPVSKIKAGDEFRYASGQLGWTAAADAYRDCGHTRVPTVRPDGSRDTMTWHYASTIIPVHRPAS